MGFVQRPRLTEVFCGGIIWSGATTATKNLGEPAGEPVRRC